MKFVYGRNATVKYSSWISVSYLHYTEIWWQNSVTFSVITFQQNFILLPTHVPLWNSLNQRPWTWRYFERRERKLDLSSMTYSFAHRCKSCDGPVNWDRKYLRFCQVWRDCLFKESLCWQNWLISETPPFTLVKCTQILRVATKPLLVLVNIFDHYKIYALERHSGQWKITVTVLGLTPGRKIVLKCTETMPGIFFTHTWKKPQVQIRTMHPPSPITTNILLNQKVICLGCHKMPILHSSTSRTDRSLGQSSSYREI